MSQKPTCNCQDKILCSPAWILYPLLDQPLLMERLEFNMSLTRIESGLCTFVILLNREIIGAKPYNTDGEEDCSQRQKSSINMKENLLVLVNYYSYGNNHYCFLRWLNLSHAVIFSYSELSHFGNVSEAILKYSASMPSFS